MLFLSYELLDNKSGGGVVSLEIFNILNKIYDKKLNKIEISMNKNNIIKTYLTFSYKGKTKELEEKILKLIEEKKIKKVFINGSIFGTICKKIKKIFKNEVQIIVFFHNFEIEYYLERAKVEGITRYLLIPNIYYNERLSIKNSDKLILLNSREINNLKKRYNKLLSNKKIYEIPIYLKDRYEKTKKNKKQEYYYLFIGSSFFANIQGISWFIEKILPNLDKKLVVVGKGMEILKEKYSNIKNLEIVGTVENLDEYYYDSNVVISPIFYGAGMKTKIIEAIMFNKIIVGTCESFTGIKEIDKIGYICNNESEFLKVLNSTNFNKKEFNSRKVYMQYYSEENILQKYVKMLKG